MSIRLLKLLIVSILLTLGYFILISYPYFFSKINRYDSLGPLSLVEEKQVNIEKTSSPERITDQFDNHLLAGEKISGKINASENNFGILLFRFAQLSAKVSDVVAFRIKKEGQDKWYYENNYKANQFQPDQYFTFGFPSFKNSKNNTYVFEIESLLGTYKNGIGVSLNKPQVALVYKYSRNDLKNYKTLSSFVIKKSIYVVRNVNFLQSWQLIATFVLLFLFTLFIGGNKTLKKKIANFSKKATRRFSSTKFYLLFLNTNTKKRLVVGILLFLFALTYRFSSTLVNQDKFFYAGLGGQGDYDQFIRAATCAVTNFCPAILGQNFLFEASILGVFYKIFGFTGALKAYLYLMLTLSSIVATLPYFLLSRKSWISIGGIFGSLFLATSDFLTNISLNFTPDNGSLFTFSIFYIVYFLTIQKGNIRWLLFFGFIGAIDALNKALFIINDLVALSLFIPVFLYEKLQRSKLILRKENIKILFLSSLPLLAYLIIYIGWEIFVYIKFSAYYFLGGLIITGGKNYVYYTSANDASLAGNIIFKLFYLGASTIVMIKRLIEYTDLQIILLVAIFLGLLFFSSVKAKFSTKKLIFMLVFSTVIVMLLILIKNNYFKIHDVFAVEDIFYAWTDQIYLKIFLFIEIVMLFVVYFKYSALKLSLPIIPYVIMLIILAKNSPFARLHTHVVVWSIILLAYLIDFLMSNINKNSELRIRRMLVSILVVLFIGVYILPKTVFMVTHLYSGTTAIKNQARYLKWVERSLPENAVILAGGKSDLVQVAENIRRPIVYSTLWTGAVLIEPNRIPSMDFTITGELQNKNNFKKKKYIILADDIYIWRSRVSGVADNLFSTSPNAPLLSSDYSIKVYKFNPTLKKAIYELNLQNTSVD